MTRVVFALAALAAGCGTDPSLILPDRPDPPPPPASISFDPARCGTVTGRVTWPGALPDSPTFLYGVPDEKGNFATKTITGPNQPRIDGATRGVAGAVVFLRGVDPAAARPWDHPPVRVEVCDGAIRVVQGGAVGRTGFVPRGGRVEVVSREAAYHVVRGRGAAFFSLALPDPDRPRTRVLNEPGRVELSSGAGYYWARADVFACDHPYYAVTDGEGRFVFERVPAGRVEVVAWHPGWLPARQDRDPESGLVSRMEYRAPVERAGAADVAAGGASDIGLTLP